MTTLQERRYLCREAHSQGEIVRNRHIAEALCAALLLSGCSVFSSGSVPSTTPEPTNSETPTGGESLPWDRVLAQSRDSVVMIQTSSCNDGPASGSGFVVGPDLVMTAAHVVDTASAAAVRMDDGMIVPADLVAYDSSSDSAVLRTAVPLGVSEFELVRSDPVQGQELAAFGYPLGEPRLSMSAGVVSALDKTIEYDTVTVDDAFITDAAINAGNSGGPVVDRSGEVIGLVSGSAADPSAQGRNFVIPSPLLVEDLTEWRDRPTLGFEPCGDDGPGPEEDVPPSSLEILITTDHEDAYSIAATLTVHGQSINEGNYSSAWALFTDANKARVQDLEAWSRGVATSYWRLITVNSVVRDGDKATAEVILRTEQTAEAGFDGQTCSIHSMSYELVLVEGVWLIDRARRPADPEAC